MSAEGIPFSGYPIYPASQRQARAASQRHSIVARTGAYWRKLKQRLKKEGSEVVTNCHGLKLTAKDGKKYLTDVADAGTLLPLVQSVPSPKAEPIKLWLGKVGYERIQEMADPEIALNRSRSLWRE
ncbi:MAG: hypothetical protein LBU06_10415 [Desulfovibrio sp.]|jgi:hypothetical protein|nr:hypothetical protein [Desulfovibrio sp.]